jgi:hypothetical protein
MVSAIGTHLWTWWLAGVQRERICATYTYEFKLRVRGNPFSQVGGIDSIAGVRLVRDLLAFHRGWMVVTSLDQQHADALDTLVFRQKKKSARKEVDEGKSSAIGTRLRDAAEVFIPSPSS